MMLDTETPRENAPFIVIASNRGPFSFAPNKDGSFDIQRGAGGLVTALGALAERHDVLWVASAVSGGDRRWARKYQDQVKEVQGIQLRMLRPDRKQYNQYYNEISNPLLWFIQHQLWDTVRTPNITRQTWDAWHEGYVGINRLFARHIAESVRDIRRPVIILLQDYHLYLVPAFLREELGWSVQIQPFLHIPWPGPDAWRLLPDAMRQMIFSSLLASDRVGFQTKKDAFNFVQTCRFYLTDAHSRGSREAIYYQGRKVDARAYPISVDVEKVRAIAESSENDYYFTDVQRYTGNRQLLLRIDRVEPSKNIIRGLQAFRTLLETHPELRGKVQMMALLVPSRMAVEEYQTYLKDIMAEAAFLDAEFGDGDWEPVRIVLGDNYQRAIAAMRLYDVLLVNPIADGMNLVAKEGVLVNQNNGVLLLSEFAGAHYQLGDEALTVSPYDIYNTAELLYQALTMPVDERKRRAEHLRTVVQDADVKTWFYAQVDDAWRALSSQSNSDSTPDTPDTSISAFSRTPSGISGDSTPTPTE